MSETRRALGKHRQRERSFRFADYSKPQSKSPKDDRTLNKRGPQVEIVRPKWNGAAGMTFRALPMTAAENPSVFEPTRLTTDDFDFSDFWRGLPAVKYVGIDSKFTFLAYDPRRCQSEGYNPRTQNPYHVLFNAVMDAVKKTGEAIVRGRDVMTGKWAPLVNDGDKKAFNAPTKMFFLQGLIYESDGELYIKGGSPPKGLRDGDLPQIIELSKTAGEKLAKKLNMLDPEYNGDTDVDNQNDMYLYGDIVDLEHGSFITLYNPSKHHDITDKYDDVEDAEEVKGTWQSWGVAIDDSFSYSVKRQPVTISGDITEYEDQIRKLVVPWDDILYYPSDEEICLMMAQAFRSMPTLLEYGWADNPEFFTDEVRAVLSNRTQVQGAESNEDEGDNEESAEQFFGGKPKAKHAPKRSAALASAVEDEVEDQEETQEEAEYEEEDPVVEQEDAVNNSADDADEDEEYEEDEYEADDDEEEVDEEEEEAARLEAFARSKHRQVAAPSRPKGPPPKKDSSPAPTAKTSKKHEVKPVKAKAVAKPTPRRA